MDKTLKLRAYAGDAKNSADDKSSSLELAKVNAQLEEEKKKSSEYSKTIEQLRESLKLEQTRTADMVRKKTDLEAKVKELSTPDNSELARKSAQLEEEQGKSLEHMRTIVQLRESLKQEQARSDQMAKKAFEQEAKAKELADVLDQISSVASAAKAG